MQFVLFASGVPEASCASFGGVERFGRFPFHLFVAGYHHLCYAFAVAHLERFVRDVYEYYAYLAAVVGIDCARCVEQAYAVFQRQAGTWAYLCLATFGQCDVKSCGYEFPLERLERYGAVEVGAQVQPCACRRGVLGQRVVGAV